MMAMRWLRVFGSVQVGGLELELADEVLARRDGSAIVHTVDAAGKRFEGSTRY